MYKEKFKLFFRFFKFILPYRKKWFLAAALSYVGTLLGLVNPYLTKLVVDEALSKKNLKSLIIIALIGGSIFLLTWLANALKGILEEYIRRKVDFALNKQLFKHIQSLSLGWFRDRSTGEHIYMFDNDIGTITNFITNVFPQAVLVPPTLLLTLLILFYLNWQMAFFVLCLAPFLYLPSYCFSKRIQKICEDLTKNAEDIFALLEEIFSHIHLVKAFGKENSAMRKYLKGLLVNIRIGLKNTKWDTVGAFTNELATKIIIGLISLYGGYQVIKGRMTLGSLTAIMFYCYRLIGLQSQSASFFEAIMLDTVSFRRIAKILDEQPQIVEAKNAQSVIFKKGEVIFNNVSFGYKPQVYILEKMSFQIESSSHIAIVGPSGCGKTTLLNLLVRLYDPREGNIFIDGYNIKDLKLSALKGQIGFCLQEPFLWNESIENNIRYGKESATIEEIVRVAQMTGVDEFAKDLPRGYQTIIGENACKLSEGQKQKIAIARALIKEPKILILDEAMSSMDSASEEKIVYNIKNNYRNLTFITVSHRLSTVMNADLVYYFHSPSQIVVNKAENLFEYNKDFAHLFIGQDKILV